MNKKPQLGILKYIGTTHFADGEWCGILLDEPCGKNDGSVRGVRYFRCRNKHGIFVHSHKVKRADETTLSKLNLLEGFSSPESSEKREKGSVYSKPRMASSDVEIVNGDRKIYKHRDVKSLRLTKRNRSVSLDRFLFQKTKQLAKSFNIFIHNPDNGNKVDIRDSNRINRSVSLPKIEKENVYDSSDYCVVGEMAPLEKGELVGDARVTNGEQNICSKSTNKTGVPCPHKEDLSSSKTSNKVQVTCSENSYSDDSLEKSKDCDSNTNQNIHSGGTVVHKVGYAVSLDTHLMIEDGKLPVSSGVDDEFSCQSHLASKEDPFIQGRHCSCPSLHYADHFSEAITTCLELGRTERSVIHEVSGETDANLETVQVTGHSSHQGVHSHSHSEALEKLFQKAKVARSTSPSSKQAEWPRKFSWPWMTSTPKPSLRSYGSCDDINTSGTIGNEDVFDEGFSSVLAHAKLISSNIADKHFKLDHSGSISKNGDIISESKKVDSVPTGSVDGDSNYADSLSGSQASLSSTGTSDSKGKKVSSKRRIPNSTKSLGSKPKPVSTSGLSAPKVTTKQSRLEQIRQQQQNHKGALPSTGNKSQLADKAVADPESKNGSKIAKRHTLATISDLKSFVPRPSVSKRPISDGVAGTVEKPNKEEVKSKLPVKKMSTPQFLRPAALPKVEKATDAASSVQRQQSGAVTRPPAASTAKKNSCVARSDPKSSKPSILAQKSKGKEKELSVVGQRATGVQTPSSVTGPKGMTATRLKPQKSQVTRSSSSAKGNLSFLENAGLLGVLFLVGRGWGAGSRKGGEGVVRLLN